MTRVSPIIAVAVIILTGCVSNTAQAQGLLFSLPEDKTGVQYQGTISQETIRDDIAEGKEVITKSREMVIKSVGRENAEFQGVVQPCRWVEIKTVTGDAGAAGIVTGPVGSQIYKVLIPESKVIDQPYDSESVPNIMLPIVKGFRRSGESAVRPIRSQALAIYPTICQLMFYPELDVVAASETPQVVAQNLSFNAKHVKGSMVMERPESRTTNEAHLWISPEVPFGLARWEVTVTREKKESTATRDSFAEVSTTKSTMSVSAILNNVESELVTQ
ncbi:MAG: hypothetical protein R3C59_19930 [Planctomycetaceae bacterium]